MGNPKTTSPRVARIASRALTSKGASKTTKTLAGSSLSNAAKRKRK